MAAAAASANIDERVPFWVVLNGVSKSTNVGNIMRSACAFGAKELVFVGKGHLSTFGSKGTNKHVDVRRFSALAEAVEYFHSQGARVLGVEITPDAKSVLEEPFEGPTALLMGNEGHGLTEKQKASCDGCVFIPQYGNGTASLNVSVAAGVVMHRFASWAGYREHARKDGLDKYHVAPPPDPATLPRSEAELALRAARVAKREAEACAEADAEAEAAPFAMGGVGGTGSDADSD